MTNEKIIKYCSREMRGIEKKYPDLINGYTDIESMNGEEAHALGRHLAYSDVSAMLEKQSAETYRDNVRQGRAEI